MIRALADIMERKQAEDRIATLLDQATDAILQMDLDGRIRFWNQGAHRIYGWSRAEASGQCAPELLHHDPVEHEAARGALLTTGKWHGEMRSRARDGRDLLLEVRWTLVRDEAGEPRSLLAINTDITEKRRNEAQYLRAQRIESLGALAGGIAHDINNVLAPILMSIEVLKMSTADEDIQESISILEVCARRAGEMVKHVVSFARGLDSESVVVKPDRVAAEVLRIAEDTFPRSIQLTHHRAPGLWSIVGSPTQLHQVLLNLCVNARDAMPNGGRLALTLGNRVVDEVYTHARPNARPGPYVEITVSDTGVGIPTAIQERIFEPFFTTKEPGKGTGLGLSTVLEIVRSHGGFIDLCSEVGRGTSFALCFPAQTGPKTCREMAELETAIPLGNGELVLIVDDEQAIRSIMQRMLARFGYRTILAGNGAEAIAVYTANMDEVAVVIVDMAMPVMDGPSTIIALTSINPAVNIIVSSGRATNELGTGVGAGLAHFIPKPYSADVVLRMLHAILTRA